ncbi:UDP-2,4-diacetamido-2,4,6-trideoxy-beta-L-altropyranose hydrolase [Halobellus ordinarius]|uniref:UDP-2,4-diacetamido-2,4, 6-trideoxy-beta-L-altropyranose hydrolase n=1 Tax=Halobellus ordinarius TaxID=3075120 RepID=UPI0028801881|nr:UDP-2,4-diacetamido-2,4,6-trideoxy-beta-L-altropyranose hydrolase [Halobellus sp. ZY16]
MAIDVTIRADGGPDIGYGHLIRSNALSEEFLRRNHRVTVATTTPQAVHSVFPNTVEVTELPSRGDSGPFVNWVNTNSPDVVFTDSYPVDTNYQREIRDQVPLAVLQDDDCHNICADLFINGNLYAEDLDYEFVGTEPQLCLGPDYVLLRREICEQANDEPPWREQPERAIVIMGGSDIANLTPTVVRAFDGFDIHVDTIVGPGFSDAQEQSIRAAGEEVSTEVSVARDPTDLVDRMFQADFAVSTSSSTTYELLALGTPIISVPVADNQEPIAAALQKLDIATVHNCIERRGQLENTIEEYITDHELRYERRQCGRRLVDCKGTERITKCILDIATRD